MMFGGEDQPYLIGETMLGSKYSSLEPATTLLALVRYIICAQHPRSPINRRDIHHRISLHSANAILVLDPHSRY